jgi:pimeloyl-ACP methyl ester carboxylesterase
MYRTIRVARSPDKMFLHDVVTEVVHVDTIIDHVAATYAASPGPLPVGPGEAVAVPRADALERVAALVSGHARLMCRFRPPSDDYSRSPGTTKHQQPEARMLTTAITALTVTAAAAAIIRAEEGAPMDPIRSGHVEANGVRYYYEIHGHGEPLLLLHGGLGSIDMFGPVLPALAASRQVIGVDLHGHGRTPLGSRRIDLIDIGNDLATILDDLGYDHVDVLGYSFGGGAALRLAIQHPARVRRLVVASAGFAQDGYFAEMLAMQAQVGAAMAEAMKDTPMYQSYAAVAPDVAEFPRLLDNMGALMRTPYDWADDVRTLAMPVMLVFGDSDMFRPEHIVEFYQLLGGGLRDAGWMREHMAPNRLAILPDLTHYEIFMAPELVTTALPFLNGKSGGPVWRKPAGTTN